MLVFRFVIQIVSTSRRPADRTYAPPSGSTRLASIHSVGVLIARLGGHLAFGIVFRRADRSRHRRSAHTFIPPVRGFLYGTNRRRGSHPRTARATTGKPQRLQRVRYGAACSCSSRRVGLCGGLCVRVSGMPHGTRFGRARTDALPGWGCCAAPGRCARSARLRGLCWGRRTAQSRARPRGVSRVYLGRASVACAGVAVRTQLVLRAPMKISGISRAYLAYAKGPDARHFGSSTFSPRSYASRVARSESTS